MDRLQALFQRSIDQQIRLNLSRTPTERFEALCSLLDTARSIAPVGSDARQRRQLIAAERQRDKERWREQYRRFLSA